MKLPRDDRTRGAAGLDWINEDVGESDTPPVRCNVAEHMERAGLRNPTDFKNAAAAMGFTMSCPRIKQFMADTADQVTIAELGILTAVLDCEVGQLYERVEASIWNVVRPARKVYIHLASRRMADHPRQVSPEQLDLLVDREFCGIWDVWAAALVLAHLYSIAPDAEVEIHVHPWGIVDGYRPLGLSAGASVRDGAVHVLIGSPAASTFTEEVVSDLFGVAPYEPDVEGAYPFRVAWSSWRDVKSSFAVELSDDVCGIVPAGASEPVAERTFVAEGEGRDAALLITYRVPKEEVLGARNGLNDGAVIACLGISGPGTLAAAQAVTRRRLRAELYPEETGKPLMRALSATYTREGRGVRRDNRKLKEWSLVEPTLLGKQDVAAPSVDYAQTSVERTGAC